MTRPAHSVLFLLALVGICLVAPATPEARVGGFPTKAITLICPFPSGATMDGIGRAAAEAVRKQVPRPVAVVNRPWGAGTIGVAEALQATPDGYTISMGGTAILAVRPHLSNYLEPMDLSAKDLPASLKADSEVYGKVIEQLGLKKK